MKQWIVLPACMLMSLLFAASAMAAVRQAVIHGDRANGSERCTIVADVDGSAEVKISGDSADLRTISGAEATWRRFQCSAPVPPNPSGFRLARVFGRGSVRLIREPRGHRGVALLRIDDPQKGRACYTFEVQWRRAGDGAWHPGSPGPGVGWAVRVCQDAVTERLHQFGYSVAGFDRLAPDPNPGRYLQVTGAVTGRRRFGSRLFSFSCSLDSRSGRVQSVDVHQR